MDSWVTRQDGPASGGALASSGKPSAGRLTSADKGATIVTIASCFFGDVALLAQASQQGSLPFVVMMGGLFVLMYLLLIMPAQRRQKKVSQMLSALKNGDKIVTTGGIYGTIVGLEDDAIQLRISDQVKIKLARNAVAGIQPEKKES
jgi:preprotein translocase subunit YajC